MKTRILESSTGMILTNGTIYSDLVFLGCNSSPDDWWEITVEEYEKIMKEREESEEP